MLKYSTGFQISDKDGNLPHVFVSNANTLIIDQLMFVKAFKKSNENSIQLSMRQKIYNIKS